MLRFDPPRSSLLFLATSVLVAVAGCGDEPSGPTGPPDFPIPAHVLTVAPVDLPRMISAVGSLESPEMTTVASEIAGTIVVLDVPEGEFVERGRIVMRLDDTEARASLKVARAGRRNAQDRLARMKQLFQGGVASQQQLDDATSAFDAADGSHRAAKTRLAKHVLRAPYSGTLGLRQVDLGDYVDPGDPIVEISDTGALELRFGLPQRHRAEVAREQVVHGVVGRCGPTFEARVIAVDPRVDPETRMVGVRAAVPNDAGALAPGMAVRVRLVVGEYPDALLVPQEAIVRIGTKHIVWVLGEEDRASSRNVTLGDYSLDQVHVTSGIVPGDRVVLDAHQKLQVRPNSIVAASAPPEDPESNPVVGTGAFDVAGCATP